ncbi:MAG: ABC transporter permease [Hyphomicrobiales bacterium]
MTSEVKTTVLGRGRHGKSLIIGGTITLLLVFTAVLSMFWTPYPAEKMDIVHKLATPNWRHWLGTDHYGRDVLSITMAGARNSLLASAVAMAIGLGFGAPLGTAAAAKGGFVDSVIARFNDFTLGFPALLSAVMITTLAGPGAINAILAIGIFNIPVFARLARGAALPLWQRDYVMAARIAGKGNFRITLDHILPNIAGILIIQATIQFAMAILAEAGLSYLGLGVQPPQASWGRMLNDAQTLIYIAPRLAIIPGIAITISVLGVNMLGDGLRDSLDPRLRRER